MRPRDPADRIGDLVEGTGSPDFGLPAPGTAEDSPRIPWEKWGPHEKGPVPPLPEEEPYYRGCRDGIKAQPVTRWPGSRVSGPLPVR